MMSNMRFVAQHLGQAQAGLPDHEAALQRIALLEQVPLQGRKHGALWVATRSCAAFFGRGGFHCVILRQADEFLDAPSELRDTLGSDIE